MGLFKKTIKDQDWVQQVASLFIIQTYPLAVGLSKAIKENNVTQNTGIDIVVKIMSRFPEIQNKLKNLPNPTSAEAQSANKHFNIALTYYRKAVNEIVWLMENRCLRNISGKTISSDFLVAGQSATYVDMAALGEQHIKLSYEYFSLQEIDTFYLQRHDNWPIDRFIY